jgi:hypothetical protein
MKHTEEEVIGIAKKIMQEIDWDYDTQQKIEVDAHPLEEYYERFKDVKGFEEGKDRFKADWTVYFDFPKRMALPERMNSFFLQIDDETGEPTRLYHEQASLIIVKSEDGKYSITNRKF